jgi:hypothetical protein
VVGHSGPTKPETPFLPRAFPELNSSGPVRCPRLQLRGSAGFAPASLSSSNEEDARTYFEKLKECNC